MKRLNFKNKKGFTLLFAVLVSVLVLAIGASVISVALRQTILSGVGRESQFAFYAANSGIECALFLDLAFDPESIGGEAGQKIFPYIDEDTGELTQSFVPSYDEVFCGATGFDGVERFGREIDWTEPFDNPQTNKYTFFMTTRNEIDNGPAPDVDDVEYCAEVVVEKEIDEDGKLETTVSSQGFNSCDPANDKRAVQRGLFMQYSVNIAPPPPPPPPAG